MQLELDPETLTEEETPIRCAACGATVTKKRSRIAMNGSHDHEFMNPAGVRFVVSCFADAPGCAPHGERSTVWTWFPGYAWQVEVCLTCRAHLGWSFHGARSFYGLIRDRLASSD